MKETNTYYNVKVYKQKKKTYDFKQLQNGTKIEMEHTPDIKLAKNIAMNHLDEDPNYYVKLSKMESAK